MIDYNTFKLLQKLAIAIGLYTNGILDSDSDRLTELVATIGNVNDIEIAQIDFPDGRISALNPTCIALFDNVEDKMIIQDLPFENAIVIIIPSRKYLSTKENGIDHIVDTINSIVLHFAKKIKPESSFTVFDRLILSVIACNISYVCLNFGGYTKMINSNASELLDIYNLECDIENIVSDFTANQYASYSFMRNVRYKRCKDDEKTSN